MVCWLYNIYICIKLSNCLVIRGFYWMLVVLHIIFLRMMTIFLDLFLEIYVFSGKFLRSRGFVAGYFIRLLL